MSDNEAFVIDCEKGNAEIGVAYSNTSITDEAIPALLTQSRSPTFLTINVSDFWLKFSASDRCCIVCFALTASQTALIPDLLRRLFRSGDANTKTKRMEKVFRVTAIGAVSQYTVAEPLPQEIAPA